RGFRHIVGELHKFPVHCFTQRWKRCSTSRSATWRLVSTCPREYVTERHAAGLVCSRRRLGTELRNNGIAQRILSMQAVVYPLAIEFLFVGVGPGDPAQEPVSTFQKHYRGLGIFNLMRCLDTRQC